MTVKIIKLTILEGNLKELDSKSVKSPGGLDNVAPDAKGIVTPAYAGKLLCHKSIYLKIGALSS